MRERERERERERDRKRERERKIMKILIDSHPGIDPRDLMCQNKGEMAAVVVNWMKSGNCLLLIGLP